MTDDRKSGIIVKGIGGFYYVKINDEIIEAKGKGILKKDGFVLAVGDQVTVSFEDEDTPVIEKAEERKNSFIRPPIANVDGMIVTLAARDPEPNYTIIDKLLVMAERSGIDILIAINKCDLVREEELEKVASRYIHAYPVAFICAEKGEGVEKLEAFAKDKKVAFAGASGVGKSTLINCLKKEEIMQTGTISAKTSRGRHTTRHVEIFEIPNGGMIFDTPGFSSYELLDIEADDLIHYYPDVIKHAKNCKYDNCRHIKEPECQVRKAVRDGRLNKERYLSYKNNYIELSNKKKY